MSIDQHDPEHRDGGAFHRWWDALSSRSATGEPHLARGPFTRWPRSADGVLAAGVFVASVVSVTLSELAEGERVDRSTIGDRPAGALVLLGLAAAALWWRRRRPLEVAAATIAVMAAWAIGGYGDGHELAMIVAVYGVGRYVADARWNLLVVGAALSVDVVGSVIDADQRVDVVPAILITVLPWYVGRRVRDRRRYLALLRERADRLESEQHARAREAVAEERARIARELHDVVAHRVSMMTVQAGAAKTVARDDIDAAVEAMQDVEDAGRQALGELRHLLGVLRPGGGGDDGLGPQPGLADVDALVADLTRAGARVTCRIDPLPDRLPAALDLSAYRIVQEATTNVVKHAGPTPEVGLRIGVEAGSLTIDVENTVTRPTTGLPASGYGIAGMRERATLLGGTLEVGAPSPDRFRVRARLPLDPEPS